MLAPALLVDEDSAHGGHPPGPAQPEHPPDHVQHVNAHVPHDPVAVFGEGPPASGVDDPVVRPHRRGAGPHLVIERLRGGRVGCVVSGTHVIIAVDVHVGDLAELPFADEPVAGLDQVRRAPPLRPDLHDPLVLAGRGDHRLALDHVDADRLLDVHVGPGLHGGDHGQGVPVVGGRDQDYVEAAGLEHRPVVGISLGRLLRGLPTGDDPRGLGEHRRVDVAERNDFHRRDLDEPQEVALAVPAAADQPDPPGPEGRQVEARPTPADTAIPAAPAWRNVRRSMTGVSR